MSEEKIERKSTLEENFTKKQLLGYTLAIIFFVSILTLAMMNLNDNELMYGQYNNAKHPHLNIGVNSIIEGVIITVRFKDLIVGNQYNLYVENSKYTEFQYNTDTIIYLQSEDITKDGYFTIILQNSNGEILDYWILACYVPDSHLGSG